MLISVFYGRCVVNRRPVSLAVGLLSTAVLCLQSVWPSARAQASLFLDCSTEAIPPQLRENPFPGGGVIQTVVAYGFVRYDETLPAKVEVTLQRHLFGPFWKNLFTARELQNWDDPSALLDQTAERECVEGTHKYRTVTEGFIISSVSAVPDVTVKSETRDFTCGREHGETPGTRRRGSR
jgi:hypothetical protein